MNVQQQPSSSRPPLNDLSNIDSSWMIASNENGKMKETMKKNYKKMARVRRKKENIEFHELKKLLPTANMAKLKKDAIIRLTTSFLKMRTFSSGCGNEEGTALLNYALESVRMEPSTDLLQSLCGFLFIVDPNGTITYISDGVKAHLDFLQENLMGTNLFNYIHMDDSKDLEDILDMENKLTVEALPPPNSQNEIKLKRTFFIRMTCSKNKRRDFVMQDFKVIHCSGYLKYIIEAPIGSNNGYHIRKVGLIAVASSLPRNLSEIQMNQNMFIFRASLDLKFTYLDTRITQLTQYDLSELLKTSLYQYIHGYDLKQFEDTHKMLLQKEQIITKKYRLMTKTGDYVWVQSYMNITLNAKKTPRFIVAVNYVSTNMEDKDLVMNCNQQSYSNFENCNQQSYSNFENPPNSVVSMSTIGANNMKNHSGMMSNKVDNYYMDSAGYSNLYDNYMTTGLTNNTQYLSPYVPYTVDGGGVDYQYTTFLDFNINNGLHQDVHQDVRQDVHQVIHQDLMNISQHQQETYHRGLHHGASSTTQYYY